MVSFKVPEVG